jgi:integrase/recombinase XerD
MVASRRRMDPVVEDWQVKVIEAFVQDCTDRGLSPGTRAHYTSCIRKYAAFLAARKRAFAGVDREILRDYLRFMREKQGLTPKTMENQFACLSTFHEFMVFEGLSESNHVLAVRKRFLRTYKSGASSPSPRKVLTVEEMAAFIGSILDTRDRAIAMLLAKTGVRRGELVSMDIGDVDWERNSILLKPKPKRTNRLVFFDEEAALELSRWIRLRERTDVSDDTTTLFLNEVEHRLDRNGVYWAIRRWGERAGISDPSSASPADRFFVHCFRHGFTTQMLKGGMPREHVAFLRGDAPSGPIDIHNRLQPDDVRMSYLAAVPRLLD